MNSSLPELGLTAEFGLQWPTWIAVGGFALFCLLGLYASLMLAAGKYLRGRYQFLQPPTLRERMLVGFILTATLPAISLALVLSERTTSERLEHTAKFIIAQANSIAGQSDLYLGQMVTDLNHSGNQFKFNSIDNASTPGTRLLELHQNLPAFLLLIAADKNGNVVASTRQSDRRFSILPIPATPVAGKSYFTQPMMTGTPYISAGIQHPQLDTAIAAAISIPMTDDANRMLGTLIGLIDTSTILPIRNTPTSQSDIHSLLLDQDGRVLFADERSNVNLAADSLHEPILSMPFPGDNELFQFDELSADGEVKNRYLATGYTLKNGWQIYLYAPLDALKAALFGDYAITLAWLAGALLISILLALLIARSLSSPLASIPNSLRSFDLNFNQATPSPPPDAPRELISVFRNLASLDSRLRATYAKLRLSVQQGEKLRGELIYTIANREKEIEKRTEELQEANQTLERLSRVDSLTGLANRRWFAQFLARAWQGALRDSKPLCILIIDIDDFKAYNDHYGHQQGDTCLQLVAEAIHSGVGRASDLVSRYGGEEFVVILGDTPLEGGLKVAETIRAAVENLAIVHEGSATHPCVTISIGVTSALPTRDIQPETVLVAADRAMYNAKNDGKNKVAYSTTARTGTFQALCIADAATSRPS